MSEKFAFFSLPGFGKALQDPSVEQVYKEKTPAQSPGESKSM